MYVRLQKIVKDKTKYGFDTKVTHIWLYTDEWKFVKFIKHFDELIDHISQAQIAVTIPLIQEYLQDQDIEKILSSQKQW